jgi:signal recognition particle receptor subunit beta
VDIDKVPYVLQLNKRDLPTAVPAAELEKALRIKNEPVIEAVASRGAGVFETLKAVVKAVLMDLKTR